MSAGPLNPLSSSRRTAWHITIGTYCSRLHGGDRPTVDRIHNSIGEPFIEKNRQRERYEQERARSTTIRLLEPQRMLIERIISDVCERGGWTLHACAAPPPPENDHIHVLLDADSNVHGKDVRKWLKRWLSEALNAEFGRPASGTWWVEDGSTKPVKDKAYFDNVHAYINRQRTTPL